MKELTLEQAKDVVKLVDDIKTAEPNTMYMSQDRMAYIDLVKALYDSGFVLGEKE